MARARTRWSDRRGARRLPLDGAAGRARRAQAHASRGGLHFNRQGDGFAIMRIELTPARPRTEDRGAFREAANTAKETSPVSVALSATEISLDATLET
jgi:hypothetical protein